MPPSDGSSRFDRCRCALAALREGVPAGSPAAPIPYRRCPVGVIADVDCPEFTGTRCGYFEDRGDAPPVTVPRTEVPLLAAELATDFLTPRYRRRLEALRTGGTPPPIASPGPDPPAPRRAVAARGVPLNVPADRLTIAGPGVDRGARESQPAPAAERHVAPAEAPRAATPDRSP